MKARNIIPGWPRSRSTSTSRRNRWENPLFHWLHWENLHDFHKQMDDFEANFRYHQQQQAMNDEYFAEYRLLPDNRFRDLRIKS